MKVNIRVRHHGSINIGHHRECRRTLFARMIFVRLDSDISFYKPLTQDSVNDHVTNHGRVNGDQRRWFYQPWVVFYRQTPYLVFLSLEFSEKQTKSVFLTLARLEFGPCPFRPNPCPIPVFYFVIFGLRFQTAFRPVLRTRINTVL